MTTALTIHHDGRPLRGRLRLDGGKHAFAHSLACAALADEGRLTGVPDHIDAQALRAALHLVFRDVTYQADEHVLVFRDPVRTAQVTIDTELSARSRSLFCLLPALLLKAERVVVEAPPRGCSIGTRPDDWYLRTLAAFGVQVERTEGATVLSWPDRRPAHVVFEYPTMTGTVVAIAAAAAVDGTSTIRNPSVEPSCDEQRACLRSMGAEADVSDSQLKVRGRSMYRQVDWKVAADRIHAVTYVTAGLLTRGRVTVESHSDLNIPQFVDFLRKVGAEVDDQGHELTAGFPAPTENGPGHLDAVDLHTGSEPLFSSDWGPFALLLLALRARGTATVTDDVFADRWRFVENLRPRGMSGIELHKTRIKSRSGVLARISGSGDGTLQAGSFGRCDDIRGTAALVVAALAADGPCTVDDDFHLRRGYTDMARDLRTLGLAKITHRRTETAA
ncbi:hypothetical protein [Streptomyces tendae]|uniref:hypothetical protein n=1 Tax=Streptomyces tendae TaxID=1932 RepID=UPI0036499837